MKWENGQLLRSLHLLPFATLGNTAFPLGSVVETFPGSIPPETLHSPSSHWHNAFRTFDIEIINVTYIRSTLGFRRVLMWLFYIYTIGVGVFLISIAWKKPDFSVPMYVITGMGISFFVIACYGFYWDYKNVPSFVADDEKLVLGRNKVYYWQDLEIVMLNAKKWMGKTDYKDIRLTFRNNRPFYLYKYAYSNIKELEAFLAERFPQQLTD